MLRVSRSLVVLLLVAQPLFSATRIRATGSRLDHAGKILVVVAHPDDEVLLAPLLAQRCVRGGARCSFLVMTTGEGGDCVRPGGCAPDLGSVRAAEMAKAAALFHADLTQWAFPDVLTGVDAAWSTHAGGRASLLQRLADAVALENPDVVFTFDPEHGTTGHEAHRTIASLLIEAQVEHLWMLETSARFEGDGFVLSNARPDRASVLFALDDWEWVALDAMLHESQFTAAQIESLRTIATDQRRVWWLER